MARNPADSWFDESRSTGDAAPELALREQGLQCLRTGDPTRALELLRRAHAENPDDHETQLSLGIALQGTRRHAEALVPLERAQVTRPENPLPFLHASLSLLALGRADAALRAAEAACTRAPLLPQAHSALGQALLALDKPESAEKSFASALRYVPRSADLWVLCGVARYRQGALEGAAAAMQEALRHAPEHAVAKDNLLALARATRDKARVSAPPTLGDDPALSVWKPKDPAASLGLAVEFLSKMPAFAKLQFGEWSQVLFYQIARDHCFFVVDRDRRVRGFLGWALADQAAAECWVEGRGGLRNDQCLAGDCVIINAFAAETPAAKILMLDTMRGLFASKRAVYFKRHYPDGRTRPAILTMNRFVAAHHARTAGRRVHAGTSAPAACDRGKPPADA